MPSTMDCMRDSSGQETGKLMGTRSNTATSAHYRSLQRHVPTPWGSVTCG
jgi:hypothetical protein